MSFRNLRELVTNNYLVKKVWSAKTYIDIGIGPISWITGKLPEIMSIIFLSEYLGYEVPKESFMGLGLAAISGLCLFGYFWKNSGLYDTEVWIRNDKDPYQKEMIQKTREIHETLCVEKRLRLNTLNQSEEDMTFNAEDINRRQKDFYKFDTYAKINGAQNVTSVAAVLSKVIVNLSSSGTLSLFDSSSTSTATPILSISVAAKDQIILDVLCTSGIYCVPVSCSPTLIYKVE